MDEQQEPMVLRQIRQDEWVNPFGASAPELLAAALEETGLVLQNTTINNRPARQLYQNYCQKRSRFQDATRLGALLIKEGHIIREQMMLGLTMQMTTTQPLADILMEMNLVSEAQIQAALAQQQKHQNNRQINWKKATRLFRHTPHNLDD